MASHSTVSHHHQTRMQKLFAEGFAAVDVMEPLLSFDTSHNAAHVLTEMQAHHLDVAGVREHGRLVGYVVPDRLQTATCGEGMLPFEDADRVPYDHPLADVIVRLDQRPRLFVEIFGNPYGVVTRHQLEISPAMRMWLFGTITIMEMRITRLIELFCPDEQWREFLSDGRLAKAAELQMERVRRNRRIQLIECLQISDKGQILSRHPELSEMTLAGSRREYKSLLKQVEALRNNLAHSQPIVEENWEMIVQIAENLDLALFGTEQQREVLLRRDKEADEH